MRPVNGDAVCAGRRPLCCRNGKSWMGAVRSCRCKDKHNLLSGQQSATINFPRSPYRCSRFCCPFAVPFAVPLRGRRRTALRLPPSAVSPSAVPSSDVLPSARPILGQPVVCPGLDFCLFFSAVPCLLPAPPPADCRPAARNFGRAARFQLQGVADADFFAIFAWRFVRAARYETKRRIAFFLRSELRQFRMQGEEADAPAVMQRGRIL